VCVRSFHHKAQVLLPLNLPDIQRDVNFTHLTYLQQSTSQLKLNYAHRSIAVCSFTSILFCFMSSQNLRGNVCLLVLVSWRRSIIPPSLIPMVYSEQFIYVTMMKHCFHWLKVMCKWPFNLIQSLYQMTE
jgi:hypothetical protein